MNLAEAAYADASFHYYLATYSSYRNLGYLPGLGAKLAVHAVVSVPKFIWRHKLATSLSILGIVGVGYAFSRTIYAIAVDFCSTRPQPDYRTVFKQCAVDKHIDGMVAPHSHPRAAEDRTKGNMFAKTFALITGSKLYSVSMSTVENNTTTGDHYYYFAKDLQSESRINFPIDGDLLQLTDVDYYVDMKKYLTGNNVLLNTFVPDSIAGSTTDAVYQVESDDYVEMRVNGGAYYRHQLWDYETDHIIVDHWWGSCLYLVEQRVIGHCKRLVFMNHIRTTYGPLARFLGGFRLKRKKMCYGDLVALKRTEGHGDSVVVVYSIAQIGASCCTNVKETTVRTAMMRCALTKTPSLADVERILRANGETDPVSGAPLVYALVQHPDFRYNCAHVTPACSDPTGYQTLKPLVFDDGRLVTRNILPTFIEGGFSPKRSYNNDTACLENRVFNVANQVKSYPPFFWIVLDEFVNLLVPDHVAGTLAPENYHYMTTKFTRPSQRGFLRSVAHVMFLDKPWVIRAFQKAEFYGKVTAPRNISTLPMDHNARLGQYSYVFVENCMKTLDWYAFSKTPQELEERLQDLASKFDYVIPTDISKCDGSRGYIHYCLDTALMTRAFGREYHTEISNLLAKESRAKGITSHQIRYECEYNTLSGSSKTSWGNTVTNAFNNYLCLRMNNDVKTSWDNLGLFGGDDGVAVGCEPRNLELTFAKLGMLLKSEVCHKGEPVPFLGRIYLDIWSTPESIIDVKRQMTKIHATVSPSYVPNNVVLWRKVEGYATNDSRTPIIRAFIDLVSKHVPHPGSSELLKYHNITLNEIGWWARNPSRFTTLEDFDKAVEIVAKQFDMTVTELLDWETKLSNISKIEDIATLTLKRDPKVEITADVGGNIIEADSAPSHQSMVTTNARPLMSESTQRRPKMPRQQQSGERSKPKTHNERPVTTDQTRRCHFILKKQPCPFGQRCKFVH